MKRIISALLVAAMLIAGSVTAFAADVKLNTEVDISTIGGEYPFATVEFAGGTVGSYSESGILLIEKDEKLSVLGAEFENPTGLAVDDAGNLYVSETDKGRIIKITPALKASEYRTGLTEPMGLCWTDGKLYIAECGKNRIVCISSSALTVVAGKAVNNLGEDYEGAYVDGKLADVRFDHPQGVCVLTDGAIFVSDTNNHALRMIKDGKSYSVMTNRELSNKLINPGNVWLENDVINVNERFSNEVLTYDYNAKKFADVSDDDWFGTSVAEALLMGLTDGVDDNHFAPSANVTRSQFACMIARIALYRNGSLVISGNSSFDDVADNTWYTDEVKWAADKTIVQGYGGKFSPDDSITRQDLVTMLYRYAKSEGLATENLASLHGYAGLDEIADYAEDAFSWAVSAGIINGRPCEVDEENDIYFGDLDPRGTASRAEAVKILVSFMNKPF